MIRRLSAVLVAAATFGVSWAMGAAMAEPGPPRLIISDVGDNLSTPISILDTSPGHAVTHPYMVALTSTAPDVTLALEIEELVDLERGCNDPESESGDTTCNEFGGELSQQLLLSAVLTTGGNCEDTTGATPAMPPTSLSDVATSGVLDLDGLVTAGAARCLLLTFDLPWAADNLVQTDLVRFDLTVHAEQALPDARVLSDSLVRGDGGVLGAAGQRSGELPTTGAAAAGLLALGLGGATTGTWLVRASRRRRRG